MVNIFHTSKSDAQCVDAGTELLNQVLGLVGQTLNASGYLFRVGLPSVSKNDSDSIVKKTPSSAFYIISNRQAIFRLEIQVLTLSTKPMTLDRDKVVSKDGGEDIEFL